MVDSQDTTYGRIIQLVNFIQSSGPHRFDPERASEYLNIDSKALHQLVREWADTTPSEFADCISPMSVKRMLAGFTNTLFNAKNERRPIRPQFLHASFVKLISMSQLPSGQPRNIRYSFAETTFGRVLVAATDIGVCHLMFVENKDQALVRLRNTFPHSVLQQELDDLQQTALMPFRRNWDVRGEIQLHVQGTEFQMRVWDALLQIPSGSLSAYGAIAQSIGKPDASRSVGTAIGSNPVAFLIPCHRVVRSSGELGGYMWGITRKAAMIGWESVGETGTAGFDRPRFIPPAQPA